MKTPRRTLAVAAATVALHVFTCLGSAAVENAVFDSVRLQLSNDFNAIITTNDGSKTTLKTIHALSNALVVVWSTNLSDELILSRLIRVLPPTRYPQYDPLLLQAAGALRERLLTEWYDLAVFSQNLPFTPASGAAERFALLAHSQLGQVYGPVAQRLKAATNTLQISVALIPARRLFSRGQASLNRFLQEISSADDDAFTADFQITKFKFSYEGSASASFDGTNIILSLRAYANPMYSLPHFAFSLDAPLRPDQIGVASGAFVDNIPYDAQAVTIFTTNGVDYAGGSGVGGLWAYVNGTNIIGAFYCSGDQWNATHGRFRVPLLHVSAAVQERF